MERRAAQSSWSHRLAPLACPRPPGQGAGGGSWVPLPPEQVPASHPRAGSAWLRATFTPCLVW